MPLDNTAPEDLIDAAEVARILGLAHRNSVSTYRSRYQDFPAARRAPTGGRTLLWPRSEILAWHEAFTARRRVDPDRPNPRLEELVAATARLMREQPGTDISIRQIAAEAGVAHSDLYRYASSKEQLHRLAVVRINDEFTQSMPHDYDTFVATLGPIYEAVLERRSALRVMAHDSILDPEQPPPTRIALVVIADLIRAHRAEHGIQSTVEPEVAAACLGAVAWGLTLFGTRWRLGLGIDEIPTAQVATVLRAVLEA
jgi:glutathione-regulated potassium-efflux system ancillary protein KefG